MTDVLAVGARSPIESIPLGRGAVGPRNMASCVQPGVAARCAAHPTPIAAAGSPFAALAQAPRARRTQ
jgi:hypothetical protein